MEFWSEEFEEKLIELWKKHACLYDKTRLTSDLLRADWLCAVQLDQLHCRSSATVELRR